MRCSGGSRRRDSFVGKIGHGLGAQRTAAWCRELPIFLWRSLETRCKDSLTFRRLDGAVMRWHALCNAAKRQCWQGLDLEAERYERGRCPCTEKALRLFEP